MKQQITESQLTELIAEEAANEWFSQATGLNQAKAGLQNMGQSIKTGANNLVNKVTTGARETTQIAAEKTLRNYISGAIKAANGMLSASPNNQYYKQVISYLQGANKAINAASQANANQQAAASKQRAHADVATQTQNAQRMAAAKQQTAKARQNFRNLVNQSNQTLNAGLN